MLSDAFDRSHEGNISDIKLEIVEFSSGPQDLSYPNSKSILFKTVDIKPRSNPYVNQKTVIGNKNKIFNFTANFSENVFKWYPNKIHHILKRIPLISKQISRIQCTIK